MKSRRVSPLQVKAAVAGYFQIHADDLSSACRTLHFNRPRQIAMFLMYDLTHLSFPQVGKEFNRDHTTAMYAFRRAQQIMATDDRYRTDVETLRTRLLDAAAAGRPVVSPTVALTPERIEALRAFLSLRWNVPAAAVLAGILEEIGERVAA